MAKQGPREKTLTERMRDVIKDLVWSGLTEAEIKAKFKVPARTWQRWMYDNVVFIQALNAEYDKMHNHPSLLKLAPLASKADRLRERQRLYDATPDDAPYKTLTVTVPVRDAAGNPVLDDDGRPIMQRQSVPVRKSNAGVKNQILDAIQHEMTPPVGTKDNPIHTTVEQTVIDRRKQEAEDLEKWEKEKAADSQKKPRTRKTPAGNPNAGKDGSAKSGKGSITRTPAKSKPGRPRKESTPQE